MTCTLAGAGVHVNLPTVLAIDFERCFALRRARSIAHACLAFVAPTLEHLAGAPA